MKYCCEICANEVLVSEKRYKVKIKLFCVQCNTETEFHALEFVDKQFIYNGDEVFYDDAQMTCFVCNKFTNYISLCFEAAVCSPKCLDKAWQEFWGMN